MGGMLGFSCAASVIGEMKTTMSTKAGRQYTYVCADENGGDIMENDRNDNEMRERDVA